MDNQELMHEEANFEDNQSEEETLADDEVKLSDGRIVKMRETTGADEAAVAQILGDKVSLQGAGGQTLVQANAIKSIVSIDGKTLPIMKDYKTYLGIARGFKTKDLSKITKKYMEMNMEGNAEDPLV